ncbi:CHASE2 domain-containing protein [Azohydromonas caseinilytica]|uniref:Adenylate/guanylate cyclase domain-containing protein n=1 Tax=Azohydromonas caseinilytica TaxID=2728836 RepID=A0A848FFX3_9BURK|nr:adenylate/guanylate cyclase domain-containing protein [Azohydromonas caseinilytica]NML18046.1 adenylate/guanylate cyclase domain-containing protein [Azohydromonas caseinilytica]
MDLRLNAALCERAAECLRRALGLGMLVALAGILAAMSPWAPGLEENAGLSTLFHLRGPRLPPADVVVVAIDQPSAQALGQPLRPAEWPRSLHARLVEVLAQAGTRVVAFDLLFATRARNPDDDVRFAAAMAHAGNVVLLDFLEQQGTGGGPLNVEQRLKPLPWLADAAAAHGPFPLPKAERVHGYWLYRPGADGAATLPVLALQVHAAGNPLQQVVQRGQAGGAEARYLDFYGPPRTVRTVSYHEVLAAAEQGATGAAWLRDTFRNRAVFVGVSAAHPSEQDRIRDDYQTVFSRADGLSLSGVEIAATAFANLLEDRAPRPLTLASQSVLLLAWGGLLGLLCTAPRARHALALMALASAGYLALAQHRFSATAQWLPLVAPLLVQAPLALFGGVLWQGLTERRERQRLGAVVQDLLPQAVVDKLLHRIRRVAPVEQEIFGAFVMTDIQGFTTITEQLTPTDATRMLNDYFALVFPPIEKHGGSVGEIVGDAVLAFWLAPSCDAGACRAACLAAWEIASLTRDPAMLPGWPPLPTRIGVHGGPLTLARVGASRHHEYQVVGDAANTASRIEALSKHLGTKLLVSEALVSGLDGLLVRPVGSFVLAGKATPLRLWELLGPEHEASPARRRLCTAFAAGLAAYEARRWDEAVARWSTLLEEFPDDGPSRFYLARAQRLAAEPPPADWDAVVRMSTK